MPKVTTRRGPHQPSAIRLERGLPDLRSCFIAAPWTTTIYPLQPNDPRRPRLHGPLDELRRRENAPTQPLPIRVYASTFGAHGRACQHETIRAGYGLVRQDICQSTEWRAGRKGLGCCRSATLPARLGPEAGGPLHRFCASQSNICADLAGDLDFRANRGRTARIAVASTHRLLVRSGVLGRRRQRKRCGPKSGTWLACRSNH